MQQPTAGSSSQHNADLESTNVIDHSLATHILAGQDYLSVDRLADGKLMLTGMAPKSFITIARCVFSCRVRYVQSLRSLLYEVLF